MNKILSTPSFDISAILFDLGNVFVKIDPAEAIQKLANASSLTAQEVLNYFTFSDMVRSYEKGALTSQEFYKHTKNELCLSISMAKLKDLYCSIFTPIQPMVRFLESIRYQYDCYLLSNTNEWHIEYCEQHYMFMQWFVHCFYSHQLHALKPDPLIYQKVLNRIGHLPEKILFIDDREENIHAAHTLGFQTIHFSSYTNFCRQWKSIHLYDKD